MQSTEGRKPGQWAPGADATSKETLEDLKEKESPAGEQDEQPEVGVPSPDGAFDESKENKDAEPM